MNINNITDVLTIPNPFCDCSDTIDGLIIDEYARIVDCLGSGSIKIKKEISDNIDLISLYRAISDCESSHGKIRTPRYEPAYASGGLYYKRSSMVRDLWREYQAAAACSYSSWQILYVVAYELGFRKSPMHLSFDILAIKMVTSLLVSRIFPACKGLTEYQLLTQIADAYNSGSPNDSIRPDKYIAKFISNYNNYR